MNDEAVYRTAPATPGLLNTEFQPKKAYRTDCWALFTERTILDAFIRFHPCLSSVILFHRLSSSFILFHQSFYYSTPVADMFVLVSSHRWWPIIDLKGGTKDMSLPFKKMQWQTASIKSCLPAIWMASSLNNLIGWLELWPSLPAKFGCQNV